MSILKSLQGLMTPEVIGQIASSMGEDKSKVSSAVSSIIPGVLGQLMHSDNHSAVESALKAASSEGGLSNISALLSGGGGQAAGGLVSALFGSKLSDFTSHISKSSGMSQGNVGKLVSIVLPLIAGFLGKQSGGGLNLASILGSLSSEKDSIMSQLPAGLGSLLAGAGGAGGVLGKLKGLFS